MEDSAETNGDRLWRGRYENFLSAELARQIDLTPSAEVQLGELEPELIGDRVALHLSGLINQALSSVPEPERESQALDLISAVQVALSRFKQFEDSDHHLDSLRQLLARGKSLPTGAVSFPVAPQTSLLDSTLIANTSIEGSVTHHLNSEFFSATDVDIIVAFIRKSGIKPLEQAIKDVISRGGRVRVLTTVFTGTTEKAALDLLEGLGAEVKVSYNTAVTRLHAKAWIFHRPYSVTTAYIGSSNLTYSAQVTGVEWNLKLSSARDAAVIQRMQTIFDSYWVQDEFRPYDPEEFAAATQSDDVTGLSGVAGFALKQFQKLLLAQLEAAREWGQHRNLLVAATGTGKTVMAAEDYARLRHQGHDRLLFLAHRKEILDQSLTTFRRALNDFSFGEKWFAGQKPLTFEHVFASVQSLHHADLTAIDPRHFDVIIIDEFHHAAASTYEEILHHFEPRELLALTATPERADGQSILGWFNNAITAELRLWDAIDQQHLVPFHYYGISDGTDLRNLTYTKGIGYSTTELTNLYTANDAWANLVLKAIDEHVTISELSALAFCVSIDHAESMATFFTSKGLAAKALTSHTPAGDRETYLAQLRDGDLQILCSVDVFNEGIDIPQVNTLLMLRPTESGVVFLQQLGRGLRTYPGKDVCTVLDFVGNHHAEFRYDLKYRALLGVHYKQLVDQVEAGFPFLPSGCHMQLDAVAQETILRNIKQSLPSHLTQKVSALRSFASSVDTVTLAGFLTYSGLDLSDIYSNGTCWSDLLERADLPIHPAGPHEKLLRKAIGRILHADDPDRITNFVKIASGASGIAEVWQRMLLLQVCGSVEELKAADTESARQMLLSHPQVCAEIIEVLPLLAGSAHHPHQPWAGRPAGALHVHARYTRAEILAVIGDGQGMSTRSWREGVLWAKDLQTDIFLMTMKKSESKFSATTMYKDYAMSPTMIHWESQSTTSAESPTGQRYQHHVERGSQVLFFARETTDDRAFWFLGSANYLHHTGSAPMAVTWSLDVALPPDLYQQLLTTVA
jgi:superfamily II DNA or RNA helicase